MPRARHYSHVLFEQVRRRLDISGNLALLARMPRRAARSVMEYRRLAAVLRRLFSILVASTLMVCAVGHASHAHKNGTTVAGLVAASVDNTDHSSGSDSKCTECCHCLCAAGFLPVVERAVVDEHRSEEVPAGSLVSLHGNWLNTESPPPRT
jgi:hypothetical protein